MQPYSSTAQLKLGRIPILFYQKDLISILSIAVHGYPTSMLTSLLVDEILLPRYINCSNFIGLPHNEEMTPSWLKDYFIFHMEINVSCCLLQAMQQWFSVFPRSTRSSALSDIIFSYLFLSWDLLMFVIQNPCRLWPTNGANVSSCKTPATMSKKSVSLLVEWTIVFLFL